MKRESKETYEKYIRILDSDIKLREGKMKESSDQEYTEYLKEEITSLQKMKDDYQRLASWTIIK